MKSNFELVELLKEKNLKISVAESITGGKIASSFIEIPGASKVIEEAFIVYSNRAKEEVLGVKKTVIDTYGVVSPEVALAMARNAKRISNSDIAISTTGEAGPKVLDKGIKVGTVCIAIIIGNDAYTYEQVFAGDRIGIINHCVEFVINEVLNRLLEK